MTHPGHSGFRCTPIQTAFAPTCSSSPGPPPASRWTHHLPRIDKRFEHNLPKAKRVPLFVPGSRLHFILETRSISAPPLFGRSFGVPGKISRPSTLPAILRSLCSTRPLPLGLHSFQSNLGPLTPPAGLLKGNDRQQQISQRSTLLDPQILQRP